MIQEDAVLILLGNQHVGGNHVSAMQLAQDARILELVRHGHRFHEAGDGLMIQYRNAVSGIG